MLKLRTLCTHMSVKYKNTENITIFSICVHVRSIKASSLTTYFICSTNALLIVFYISGAVPEKLAPPQMTQTRPLSKWVLEPGIKDDLAEMSWKDLRDMIYKCVLPDEYRGLYNYKLTFITLCNENEHLLSSVNNYVWQLHVTFC